jgi:UDP-N-acetylmuramate dehydrogenase
VHKTNEITRRMSHSIKKIVFFDFIKNQKTLVQFEYNKSIQEFTTFAVPVQAEVFCAFSSIDELKEILSTEKHSKREKLILGGGSNMLFTKDFEGLVLKNEISGKEIVKETEKEVFIKAGAGENWHEFVLFCVSKNWGGIENLSLIPGNVGASPMQNIGAYGVEIKDVFHSLEALNLETLKIETFSKEECRFGYRESIFKNSHKGKYIITSVTFELQKQPVFNTSYGAIESQLKEMNVSKPSVRAISEAVIAIRSSKLPDPRIIGNAGSFFKNPVISGIQFNSLKTQFPQIANYPQKDGTVKIAAGWLIDQMGWKGKTIGSYGVHKNQALVLVNYGGAIGKDIYDLSSRIIQSVSETYGITLEREVNLY